MAKLQISSWNILMVPSTIAACLTIVGALFFYSAQWQSVDRGPSSIGQTVSSPNANLAATFELRLDRESTTHESVSKQNILNLKSEAGDAYRADTNAADQVYRSSAAGELSEIHQIQQRSDSITITDIEINKIKVSKQGQLEFGDNPFSTRIDHLWEQVDSHDRTASVLQANQTPDDHLSDLETVFDAALDDNLTESISEVEINFTYTPLATVHPLSDPTEIGKKTVVYANLHSTTHCKNCILKWEHQVSGEIEFLIRRSLFAGQIKTFYITPENGWRQGKYYLSIYTDTSPTSVVGRGSVFISNVSDELSDLIPPNEYIQSLLESGLAYRKSN